MIYKENMFNTNSQVTFFDSYNIAKRWNVNLIEEKNLLPSVVKLANDWNVPYIKIIAFIKANNLVRDCFMYSLYGGENSRMVAEKGVYSEKRKWSYGSYTIHKTYHNVYIKENTYIHLMFPKIIEYIITTYYPKFAIYGDSPRFDKKISIKPNTSITEIEREYRDCKLTALDIVKLLDNPNYSTETVKKLKYKIYSDGDTIYYPITSLMIHGHKYDISLYVPREAIINDDWSIVENQKMGGIIKPNANELLGRDKNNWFEGLQKDSPYFNHKEVETIKKRFKVLN
jgi:hypothetical protein